MQNFIGNSFAAVIDVTECVVSAEGTYDVLADPPSDCEEEAAQQIVFEGSEQPFLPIYFLQLDKLRQYVWLNC